MKEFPLSKVIGAVIQSSKWSLTRLIPAMSRLTVLGRFTQSDGISSSNQAFGRTGMWLNSKFKTKDNEGFLVFLGPSENDIVHAVGLDRNTIPVCDTLNDAGVIGVCNFQAMTYTLYSVKPASAGVSPNDREGLRKWIHAWMKEVKPYNGQDLQRALSEDVDFEKGSVWKIASIIRVKEFMKNLYYQTMRASNGSITAASGGPTHEQILDQFSHMHMRENMYGAGDDRRDGGHYLKPFVRFAGFDIWIENPAGSFREGVDETGRPWKSEMFNSYGEFACCVGVDNDKLDVYLGPNPGCSHVYVVRQACRNNWKQFDEDKVMLGFDSEEEARQAYLKHYDDSRYLLEVNVVPRQLFKRMIYNNPNGQSIADCIEQFKRRGLM